MSNFGFKGETPGTGWMMPLAQEEIDARMMKFHDEFQDAWKAKDVKTLASMYHPDGTLVAAGYWVARGPKGEFLILSKFRMGFSKNILYLTIHEAIDLREISWLK